MALLLKIIEVEWEDASGGHYWDTAESLSKERIYIVKTVGYVVRDDDEYVILVQCVDNNKDGASVSGHMRIPRAYIRSSRVMRKGTLL